MSPLNTNTASSAPSSSANDRRSTRIAADVDWTRVAQTALGSALFAGLLSGAFYVIGKVIESDTRVSGEPKANAPTATPFADGDYEFDEEDRRDVIDDAAERDETEDEPAATERPFPVVDDKIAQAAAVLGIAPDATEDEIRAALRAHLSASRLHPDQGGDSEQAKRLIAAKNLLIERARAVRL